MRFAWVFMVACGGGGSGPVTASGPPAALIAVPSPGDVEVATVNGRPVFGSCVADQIKRTPTLTKPIALQQCVDLELLAQTAEGKQLATTGEVIDATRTALVRRLADAFEAKYPDPESLRTQIDDVYKQVGTDMRPEYRGSRHAVAVAVTKDVPEALHLAARQTAEQIYQRLGHETGLFAQDLDAAVAAVKPPPGITVNIEELGTTRDNPQWAAEYKGALFAIPEVGRVSSVTKTEYGYHVILLTDLKPAARVERTQVFFGLRRKLFVEYVQELMSKSAVEQYPELLEPPAQDEAAP